MTLILLFGLVSLGAVSASWGTHMVLGLKKNPWEPLLALAVSTIGVFLDYTSKYRKMLVSSSLTH